MVDATDTALRKGFLPLRRRYNTRRICAAVLMGAITCAAAAFIPALVAPREVNFEDSYAAFLTPREGPIHQGFIGFDRTILAYNGIPEGLGEYVRSREKNIANSRQDARISWRFIHSAEDRAGLPFRVIHSRLWYGEISVATVAFGGYPHFPNFFVLHGGVFWQSTGESFGDGLGRIIPYSPLWLGLAGSLTAHVGSWWILLAVIKYTKQRYRRAQGRCAGCGYIALWSGSDRCPECGLLLIAGREDDLIQ